MNSWNVIKLVEIILVNISLRVELETHSVTMNAENWQLSCAFTDKKANRTYQGFGRHIGGKAQLNFVISHSFVCKCG